MSERFRRAVLASDRWSPERHVDVLIKSGAIRASKREEAIRKMTATRPGSGGGGTIKFETTCRIDTPVEVEYYRNGGILHTVLRKMAKA